MDNIKNPFAPGAGTPPPALVGREDVLGAANVTLERIKEGRAAKSLLLIGLRGVGKTVLLNRFQEKAESLGYKTALIEASDTRHLPALIVPPLRKLLLTLDRAENVTEHVKRCLRVLRSFAASFKLQYGEVGLSIDPEIGCADSGDLETDLTELLVTVGEAARARGKPVSIMIDEMQYLEQRELSALIMAIHKICQKQLPLVLMGAGLPQLVGITGKTKSYAERLFDFPRIAQLQGNDARNALLQPVRREGEQFSVPALDLILEVTQGYPYFLQEWGYHTWNVANSSPISPAAVHAAKPIVIKRLDQNFFRVRFDRLTPRERQYMRAMAELSTPSQRSGDIAAMMGVDVHSVAPIRSSLIKKGMIYSPAHGDTAYTVPLFDGFMKRIMPDVRSIRSTSDPEDESLL
jgi:hypothetical protein